MVKGLGNKIQKGFSSLGQKATKLTNNLGNKTNSVIREVKGVANVLENKMEQVKNTANNIVNKIPEYNEKAISMGNTIIKKSGGITDALRKGSNIGDRIISGVGQLGGNIPIVGNALQVASKGTHQLAVGAKKLDKIRDNADKKLNKYADVSRETISDIEKMNQRKKNEMIRAQESGDVNFA